MILTLRSLVFSVVTTAIICVQRANGESDLGSQLYCTLSFIKSFAPEGDSYLKYELMQAATRAESLKKLGNKDYIAAESHKSIGNDRPSEQNWKLMDVDDAVKEMKNIDAKSLEGANTCSIQGIADAFVKFIVERLITTNYDIDSNIMGLIETGGKNIVYVRTKPRKYGKIRSWTKNRQLCKDLGGKMAEDITKEDFDRLYPIMYFTKAENGDYGASYFVGARSTMRGPADWMTRTKSSFVWLESGKIVDEKIWGYVWREIMGAYGLIEFKQPHVDGSVRGGFNGAFESRQLPVLCQFD